MEHPELVRVCHMRQPGQGPSRKEQEINAPYRDAKPFQIL